MRKVTWKQLEPYVKIIITVSYPVIIMVCSQYFVGEEYRESFIVGIGAGLASGVTASVLTILVMSLGGNQT